MELRIRTGWQLDKKFYCHEAESMLFYKKVKKTIRRVMGYTRRGRSMAEIRSINGKRTYLRAVKNTAPSEEDKNKPDYKTKIRRHRQMVFYRILLAVVVIVAAVIAYVVYANNKIYSGYSVTSQQEWSDYSGLKIQSYYGHILTYGKDGMVCTSTKGKTLWNQSFEMQNPIVAVRGEYVAAGDYNGTMIYLVNEAGTKWTIDTRMPIRNLDVSEKGTVLAVLDDGTVTWLYLYNKEGDVLLQSPTSMPDYGYPLSVAISDDSMMLAVSYLYADSGAVTSRIAFYNLNEVGDNYQDNLVSGFSYHDAVVPMLRFMDNETSFAVADNRLMIYSGKQIPSSTKEILLMEEIQSVFYGKNYIGLVYLNTESEEKYRMDTYDTAGNLVQQYRFNREYDDIVFKNDFVYIYNQSGCDIYNMKGVLKYTGDFEIPVECLIPGESREKMTLIGKNVILHISLK